MLVQKIKGGYQFTSITFDCAFIIKLTLPHDGKERLETCPVGAKGKFKPRILPRGTIKKAIGPERWKNFLSMKEKNIDKMFIDPYRGVTSPRTW
jgi:hypothetical protein